MADVQVAEVRKKGGKKKKRRLAIHIDMTPMVDVSLLLLTFFMLTTAFSRPQAMEINLPPSDTKVEIAASNLMTLLVADNGDIYWKIGTGKPALVAWGKDFRKLVIDENKANPRLVTLIKVDRKAKYQDMINILDELNLDNVTRFSLAPITPQDKQELAKVGAQ